ncbi:hypothetical protein U9M48_041622 [Paspalum notatum var. saurae]|uniref:Receptor-like serine/threonine-protein kinase n=1 Tax=Paspalum notatum var. saurae TaxID=547442 RepID=A0AAQ3XDJ1_PASNO
MPPMYMLLLVASTLLSSLLSAPWCCAAATADVAGGDTLAAGGRALAAGDRLVSRNGKFALGFFQFQPPPPPAGGISKSSIATTNTSSVSPGGWYLGIWFAKIPVCTVVWVANRERPITDPEQLRLTRLTFLRDGNLAIVLLTNNSNPSTETVIWSTSTGHHVIPARTAAVDNSTNTTSAAAAAVLMDTGNLVLTAAGSSPSSSNGSSPPLWLWQSFDYPTDVGLAGTKLGRNKVTGFNRRLISRKSLVDPGLGSYILEVDSNGVLFHRRRKAPFVVYWSWSSGDLANKLVSVLNGLMGSDPRTRGGWLKPIYVNDDHEEYFSYASLDDSKSTFVSVDIFGQIKLNIWSQEKQVWETIYAQPADPCSLSATCGPFTVCNGGSAPFCSCMESFSPKSPRDWEVDDATGGCVRDNHLDCRSSGDRNKTSSTTDVFHAIAHVTLPSYPQAVEDAVTQGECEEACLGDCSCTAYSYSPCSVWHGELFSLSQRDGIEIFSENVLYLRLATTGGTQTSMQSNKRRLRIVTAAGIAGSVLLVFMLLLLIIIRSKRKSWRGVPSLNGIIAFRYTDLVHATKNFSDKLGGGGFGSVFNGTLGDQTAIAVKRLDGARQGEKQFRAEVSSVGLIQHINLVKLIGFCCQGDKRLLVYERMLNGSLDTHLFRSNATTVLSWRTRYQVALGVARGLCYLHQSCRECIIHCDIKPENILLDASFVPKIADFGMAAIVGRDFSRVLTTFRGTIGYLAPEWLSGVAITPKVDVYSFGMVLLEIISGRRNALEMHTSSNYHAAYFPVQAISKLHEGDIQSLADPQLQGDFDLEVVERVCKVAFWCIQDDECDRPTMGEVVQALEGLQELDMPPMPRLLAAIIEPTDAVSM